MAKALKYGNLPFDEAIAYFNQKGYALSPNSWRDVWQQAHARAFTVAQVTAMEVLEDIRGELKKAVDGGQSIQSFKKNLKERLTARGWFAPDGEDAWVTLPDGTRRKRLTPWRLDTIFRANVQSAYQVGRFKQMQDVKERRPYWQYKAILDKATRDEHAAMHNKVYHADHPVWDQWYPPNGFNCRCYVKTLSEKQLKARGLKEQKKGVRKKPDEGWRYNVGQAGLDEWKPDVGKYSEKAKVLLTADLQRVFFEGMELDEEIEAFIRNRRDLPDALRPFITPHTVEDYKGLGAKIYMTPDGKAGYAITRDKELISLFSKPGAHLGSSAVTEAIERGAEKLDCFDGKLPGFYADMGFEEMKRLSWDDRYAPEGWDYEAFGRPNVVFMQLAKRRKR